MLANIYFSKGTIKTLVEKESLLKKSTQTTEVNKDENVEFRLENSNQLFPILKIVDFVMFDTEITSSKNNVQTRIGLVIHDGLDELTCTIELDTFHNCFKTNDQEEIVHPDHIIGHFFCLLRYKIKVMDKFLKPAEYRDYIQKPNKPEKIISITKLQLIGKITDISSPITKQDTFTETDFDSLQIPLKKIQNDFENECHSINELNCSHSKISWSIKCRLDKKTLIREYENRQNGSNGYVIRCLFSDRNKDFIELVAFNKFCTSKPFKMLQERNIYLIKNGDVKQSKINLKSWPEIKSVSFEIHVNQQTEFILCDDTDFSIDNCEPIQDISKESDKVNIQSTSKIKLYEKFTPLSKICLKPIDSFIDILVILKEIGNLKKLRINSKPISIRNVDFTDFDFNTINAAFWGKQAEEFNYTIGACLLINQIKVSNYSGRSLSVMRQTEILEIKKDYDIEPANKLIDWWNKICNKEQQADDN